MSRFEGIDDYRQSDYESDDNEVQMVDYSRKVSHLLSFALNRYKLEKIKHYAIFFNSPNTMIAFGFNNERPGSLISIHAEVDALNKLKKKPAIKNKHYDLLVVRLTKTNILGESRPCQHCIQSLLQSGIKIRNVYYSTKNGTIACETLKTMIDSDLTYISTGYRRFCKSCNH